MNRFSFVFIASVLAISGVFAALIKPLPSRMTKHEVPARTSQRGLASAEEGSSSQPAALSVRPPLDATADQQKVE
jgi:hypothetical protein